MKFTVDWTAEALDGLSAAWEQADDRAAVTAAAHRIDTDLRALPLALGESRPGDYRLHFDPPLAVLYQVAPDRHYVLVAGCGPNRRPRP